VANEYISNKWNHTPVKANHCQHRLELQEESFIRRLFGVWMTLSGFLWRDLKKYWGIQSWRVPMPTNKITNNDRFNAIRVPNPTWPPPKSTSKPPKTQPKSAGIKSRAPLSMNPSNWRPIFPLQRHQRRIIEHVMEPTTSSICQEIHFFPTSTLYKRLFDKPRIQEQNSEHSIRHESNSKVSASNSFKIPEKNAEDLHLDKWHIIQTALERALTCMSTVKNPTNTRRESVRTVDSIKEIIKKAHFTSPRNRKDHNSDSDDDVKSSKSAAFQNISTFLKTPRIDEERAETTTANHNDKHWQNCKLFSECPPDQTGKATPKYYDNAVPYDVCKTVENFYPQLYLRKSSRFSHIISMLSYATIISFCLRHLKTRPPVKPPAFCSLLPRTRTPASPMTLPTVLVQQAKLVKHPSVIHLPEMPSTPTSTTTFSITVLT
jgi:hypothetical protein